jgi:hypothetical protein
VEDGPAISRRWSPGCVGAGPPACGSGDADRRQRRATAGSRPESRGRLPTQGGPSPGFPALLLVVTLAPLRAIPSMTSRSRVPSPGRRLDGWRAQARP